MLMLAQVSAKTLTVAVASNFKSTAQKISHQFEQQTGHKITLVSGSTGSLFHLISHGAPYDIFLSADAVRPQKLVSAGLAFPESRFTYAVGQLAFWSPNHANIDNNNIVERLKEFNGKLAIANPRLAPYGESSLSFLKKNNLLDVVNPRLVRGNNITQALQFVTSGNAQSGFVSYSELLNAGVKSNFFLLNPNSYSPINQQAVILKRTQNIEIAKEFMDFVNGNACDIILLSGYALAPSLDSEQH